MTSAYKKRKKTGGKLAFLFLVIVFGGLALLATQDIPAPTQTITKTITPPAQQ